MSFILDALKKAESERSRNNGPVLMDVRIAPGRQRLPAWAWVMGCMLLANLLLLAWVLLRRPATTPPVVAATVTAAAPAPAATTVIASAPAVATPVPSPAPVVPPAAPAAPIPIMPAPPVQSVAAPAAVTLPPALAPRPVAENLPTMQELAASGVVLPALQLSLHVYDETPVGRYVLLNGKRLREGDELSDGIKLERITPRGVVLNALGRRFLLPAGN